MDPNLFEFHLLTIQKFLQKSEKTAKILSEISKTQLQKIAQKCIFNKPEESSTPITLKLLKNWRDEAVSPKKSKTGLFSLKRKNPSFFSKTTDHKQSHDNEEVLENSSEDDKENNEPTDWVKLNKTYWKEGLKKYDPDELFNPAKTPNGKGFVCNLDMIFTNKQNSFRNRKASEAVWKE